MKNMATNICKVKVFIQEYGIETYYYRQQTVHISSCFDAFKNDLKQRYAFLDETSLKISWLDNDGDKIKIFNEEDMLTFKLLEGTKLLIEACSNNVAARESNIAHKLPEEEVYDRHNDKENYPKNGQSHLLHEIQEMLKEKQKRQLLRDHLKSKSLTVSSTNENHLSVSEASRTNPFLGSPWCANIPTPQNSAKKKQTWTFSVAADTSSVFSHMDKFKDTARSFMDARNKNNENYTEGVQATYCSSCSNTSSRKTVVNNELQSSVQTTSSPCVNPSIFFPITDDLQDTSRNSMDVQEKMKKSVRFSLPQEDRLVHYSAFRNTNEINDTSRVGSSKYDDNVLATMQKQLCELMTEPRSINVEAYLDKSENGMPSVEQPNPVIEEALIKLAEMGYCSQGRLFADLLESVDGDIIRFFERYEIDQIFN